MILEPPPFAVDVAQRAAGIHVVALAGELDLATAPDLAQALAGLAGIADARVIVDLSELTFIDSTGIKALITAAKVIEASRSVLVLAGPNAHLIRAFEIVRLAQIIPIEPSVDAALVHAENGGADHMARPNGGV